jgi:hypothetical protein
MKLHVLTACTRPENLPALAASLAPAAAAGVDLHWHVGFDLERRHPGGQGVKNALLDDVADGWVWILDDDNTAAPGFFAALARVVAREEAPVWLVACAQRTAGGVRYVSRGTLRPTHVDTAQLVARRDVIGAQRIPEHYCGDGEWIAALAAGIPDAAIVYLNDPVVVTYNALRGGRP